MYGSAGDGGVRMGENIINDTFHDNFVIFHGHSLNYFGLDLFYWITNLNKHTRLVLTTTTSDKKSRAKTIYGNSSSRASRTGPTNFVNGWVDIVSRWTIVTYVVHFVLERSLPRVIVITCNATSNFVRCGPRTLSIVANHSPWTGSGQYSMFK